MILTGLVVLFLFVAIPIKTAGVALIVVVKLMVSASRFVTSSCPYWMSSLPLDELTEMGSDVEYLGVLEPIG
jgi:hypothetical protein